MNLLQIKNLVTTFTTGKEVTTAIKGVSFDVAEGETVGIVGESGSGKSVTSLSIMGLLPAVGKVSSGEIIYKKSEGIEVDLTKLSEKEMQKYRGNDIAMIFQEPMTSLNPVHKCGDQVAEIIQLHKKCSVKEAKKQVIELFKKVELPRPQDIYTSYPHQLSGGQKQRVMIAMAISCNPRVLIADEPTTALDVTVQKTILQLLKNLQQEYGMGLIFITHDLGVVAEIADKVVVMYKGDIVEQGTAKQLFNNPQHPYTKGLLACRPPLNYRLKKLPTVADFLNDESLEMKAYHNQWKLNDSDTSARQKLLFAQEPLLHVNDLQTYFPIQKGIFSKVKEYVKAVDTVNFNVFPGETMGLVGESGCGKTTLSRTILRLNKPTAGEIIYKGQDIAQLEGEELRKLRKEIQIIFQDPYSSLNPRLTIGEAIVEPMLVHNISGTKTQHKEKVKALLERVGLSGDFYNRYPHEFSGGQRQRIGIARALALEPEFIIADESVSALDVSVQAQVLNLLNELKEEFGLTYIFISHDLSVVKFMSDRMIVMNKGKIEESGLADEVYNHPKKEYTKHLIEAIPKGEAILV